MKRCLNTFIQSDSPNELNLYFNIKLCVSWKLSRQCIKLLKPIYIKGNCLLLQKIIKKCKYEQYGRLHLEFHTPSMKTLQASNESVLHTWWLKMPTQGHCLLYNMDMDISSFSFDSWWPKHFATVKKKEESSFCYLCWWFHRCHNCWQITKYVSLSGSAYTRRIGDRSSRAICSITGSWRRWSVYCLQS